jgi:molecular chaperone GrpE
MTTHRRPPRPHTAHQTHPSHQAHPHPAHQAHAAQPVTDPGAEIERLEAELAEARRQSDEYLAGLQRERAEFINYKRRTTEEREAALGLASESLLRKVLALADDFDRAIEARPEALVDDAWVDGIAAIDRKLRMLLESEGVSPIVASPGTAFDPREHEAVVNLSGTGRPDGEIVEEIIRGYRLRDRVLRPSVVAVAGSPDEPQAETGSETATETTNTTDTSND